MMSFNSHAKLSIDIPAPAFELRDQENKLHKLSDYAGSWLVLYFYPKDDTPGCTREACNFRDDISQFRTTKADVVGISTDNIDSHAAFAKKYSLPFTLLADRDAIVAKAYGAAWKVGPFSIVRRHTIIISPEGEIAKIYRKVVPKNHSAQIITDLKKLQVDQ